VLTILPALLLSGMGVAWGLVAAGFGYGALYAVTDRCTDCPIDRSGQFLWIFLGYAVVLLVISVVHLLLSVRIWRGGERAAVAGIVVSAMGLAVLLLFWSRTYALFSAVAALAYAIALVTLLASRLRAVQTA
jgi:hypothetical protein